MGVERLRIPDSDVPGWIQALREGGFTQAEIDYILSRKNEMYAKHAGIDAVEETLAAEEAYLLREHKRKLTPEQREYMREGIKWRLWRDDKKESNI